MKCLPRLCVCTEVKVNEITTADNLLPSPTGPNELELRSSSQLYRLAHFYLHSHTYNYAKYADKHLQLHHYAECAKYSICIYAQFDVH